MMVPPISILCMAVSALLCIGVPVALLIVARRKFGAKIVPVLVGAAAFVVFVMVLRRILQQLILNLHDDGSTWMTEYPFWYMLYLCLFVGIIEETGRFLSFKLLKRRYDGIGTGLGYGVGFGGGSAILLGGVAMINTLIFSVIANSTNGSYDLLVFMEASINAAQPPSSFLLSGVDQMFALTKHISLSVIVFYSVCENRRLWLYPAAILLSALINIPAALVQVGVLTNGIFNEAFLYLGPVILALIAFYTYRRLKPSNVLVTREIDTFE